MSCYCQLLHNILYNARLNIKVDRTCNLGYVTKKYSIYPLYVDFK